jgi:hypothetical protein
VTPKFWLKILCGNLEFPLLWNQTRELINSFIKFWLFPKFHLQILYPNTLLAIYVDFDKICVFCDKCYFCINICVFIIVKIKCMNSGIISDICDKVNFTTKLYTFYNT